MNEFTRSPFPVACSITVCFFWLMLLDPASADNPDGIRKKLLLENGGNAASEAAVASGLKWILSQQGKDGGWTRNGKPSAPTTALALLPFLACDITHKSGKMENLEAHVKCVEKGLKFVLDNQQADGSFHKVDLRGNCWCAFALAEAYRRSKDPALKAPATRAILYLVKQQNKDGGFGADASNVQDTGHAVFAIWEAWNVDIEKPRTTSDEVRKYLDSVGNEEGSAYAPAAGQKPTVEASAMALLCRVRSSGWGVRTPGLVVGMERLTKDAAFKSSDDISFGFVVGQLMYEVGGKRWDDWNPKHRDKLLELQDKGSKDASLKGSWSGTNASPDRLETTCLAVLSLEVYYFHVPRRVEQTLKP